MSFRINLKFTRATKVLLVLILATAWLTGGGWYALHRWGQIEGEFGPEKSPWEPVLMRIHGGASMLIMVGFGYLLATHVPIGIRSKRQRLLGLTMVGALTAQILTAYCLYYAAGEEFREWVSTAHLCVGLGIPFILALHVWTGKRGKKRGSTTSA